MSKNDQIERAYLVEVGVCPSSQEAVKLHKQFEVDVVGLDDTSKSVYIFSRAQTRNCEPAPGTSANDETGSSRTLGAFL